jgi:hypothetical protein
MGPSLYFNWNRLTADGVASPTTSVVPNRAKCQSRVSLSGSLYRRMQDKSQRLRLWKPTAAFEFTKISEAAIPTNICYAALKLAGIYFSGQVYSLARFHLKVQVELSDK